MQAPSAGPPPSRRTAVAGGALPPLLRDRWLRLVVASVFFLLPLVGLPVSSTQSPSQPQPLALRSQPVRWLQVVASEAGAILYVQTDGNLLRSLDGGRTFVRVDAGLPRQGLGALALEAWRIAPGDPWQLYALAGSRVGPEPLSQLYRGREGGAFWELLGRPWQLRPDEDEFPLHTELEEHTIRALALTAPAAAGVGVAENVAVADSVILYLGTDQGLWRSVDGGLTWRGGGTWPEPLKGESPLQLVVDGKLPSHLYASAGTGLWISQDAGASWLAAQTLPPMAEVSCIAAASSREGLSWVGGRRLVYRTEDGGHTWQGVEVPAASGMILSIAPDPQVVETLYALDSAGQIFRSDDAGASWLLSARAPANALGLSLPVLAVDPAGRNRVYLGTDNGLWAQPVSPLEPTPTATATPTLTATATRTPTATRPPQPTATATSSPTPSPTSTPTQTATATDLPTATSTATATETPTVLPTNTPSPTFTVEVVEPPPTSPPGDGGGEDAPTPTETVAPVDTPAPTATADGSLPTPQPTRPPR